jgi:hypothetical protein
MSITGHSRGAIAKAIKEAAQTDRPNEKRDWDVYAQRAASYAAMIAIGTKQMDKYGLAALLREFTG